MIEFFLHIGEDGQLMNPKVVRDKFSQLETGRWLVQMKRSNNRTIPMNSYLHGVLIPEFRKALNVVGYNEVKTDDQAKEIMKNMFLKTRVVNEITGEVVEYVRHTSDLSTIEMSTLFEEVIQFTAEHMSHQIPYPNEQLRIA